MTSQGLTLSSGTPNPKERIMRRLIIYAGNFKVNLIHGQFSNLVFFFYFLLDLKLIWITGLLVGFEPTGVTESPRSV